MIWITLKITTSALKTINKIGIKAALKDAKLKGFKIILDGKERK